LDNQPRLSKGNVIVQGFLSPKSKDNLSFF
jgi:hypothetical protein